MSNETVEDHRAASITRLLGQFGSGDFDGAMDLFSGDVEMRLPYQDEATGFWSHISGRPALRRLLASIPKLFDTHVMHLDEIYHATDGQTVIARYHGDFTVRETTKPYRNSYVAIFEFRNDEISSWTEIHNPLVLAEALRP